MRQVGVFHRDISFENIMVRRCDGVVYGVLNDFDLALDLRQTSEELAQQGRTQITGTRLFMARELLQPKFQVPHSGRHDMESLFWVVIWFIYRYQDGQERALGSDESRPFDDWLATPNLAAMKSQFLINRGADCKLPPVWKDAWIQWARNLTYLHLDAATQKTRFLESLEYANPMAPEQRETLESQLDTLDFKDDSTAWKAFIKVITGASPEDYPLNPLYRDYDRLSAIQF